MPIPEFIVDLRRRIGHDPLWLMASSGIVLRRLDGVDHVLLVRTHDESTWTVPAGVVDPGEEPHDAAVREVLEETGVTCQVDRLAWVYTGPPVVHLNGDQAQYVELVFTCSWVSGEPFAADDESIDARWCAVDELPEMSSHQRARVAAGLASGAVWLGLGTGLYKAGET